MAVVKGGYIDLSGIQGGLRKKILFSGTVTKNGSGVVRQLKGYKVGVPDAVFSTQSASDGTWSLEIPGGSNDKFRIICIGVAGENSEIYDGLSG